MSRATLNGLLVVVVLASFGAGAAGAWELSAEQKDFVDRWIVENGFNQYGDPKGTVYVGGTPLFNEATGESIDRYDYILVNHPELADVMGLKPDPVDLGEELRRLETELECAQKDLVMEQNSAAPDKALIESLRVRIANLEKEIQKIQAQMARFRALYR